MIEIKLEEHELEDIIDLCSKKALEENKDMELLHYWSELWSKLFDKLNDFQMSKPQPEPQPMTDEIPF